jgi:hypothetical protein
VAIGILYLAGLISGTVAIFLGILAIIWIITSMTGFCPTYHILKISTKKKE